MRRRSAEVAGPTIANMPNEARPEMREAALRRASPHMQDVVQHCTCTTAKTKHKPDNSMSRRDSHSSPRLYARFTWCRVSSQALRIPGRPVCRAWVLEGSLAGFFRSSPFGLRVGLRGRFFVEIDVGGGPRRSRGVLGPISAEIY